MHMHYLTKHSRIEIIIFLLLIGGISISCALENVKLIGNISGGFPRAVTVRGTYAYVASQSVLSVMDIADHANPKQVSWYDTPGNALDLFINDSYLYIACGEGGLQIYDIGSDPSAPIKRGSVDKLGYGYMYSVFVSSGCAFVANGTDGLRIIDISNPSAPAELAWYQTTENAFHVAVAGNYAYVVQGKLGLQIIDVSDPRNPLPVGSYESPDPGNPTLEMRDIAIADSCAYIVNSSSGIYIIDISTPAHPNLITISYDPLFATGIAIAGTNAYLADGVDLKIFDISKSSSPSYSGTCGIPGYGYAYGVSVQDDYAYLACGEAGFRVMSVADPYNPSEIGKYETPATGNAIAVASAAGKNYVFVAEDQMVLRIVDVNDPSQPTLAKTFELDGHAKDIFIDGAQAFIAEGSEGLRILDISNPVEPLKIALVSLAGESSGVYVRNSIAFVAAGNAGLCLIDLNKLGDPPVYCDTSGSAFDVAVDSAGEYAYIADNGAGMRIIDIRDPAYPVEVGYYDTACSAQSIAVYGSYAYVADGSGGLKIFDVNNTAAPRQVGSLHTSGKAYGITIEGNYAYLADGSRGLRIIDIADPERPAEAGFFDTPGSAVAAVYVTGRIVHVADYGAGLFTVEVDRPIISTITPSSAKQGQTLDITVTGENFNQTIVSFSGTGLAIFAQTLVDPNTITVTVAVSPQALIGGYDVTVTNANGLTDVKRRGIEVTEFIDPQPPAGSPSKPAITQDGNNARNVLVTWTNGTCEDLVLGIAGYYLEIGTSSGPDKFFHGDVIGLVLQKKCFIPEDATIYARVCGMNGFGLRSDFSLLSDSYTAVDTTPPTGRPSIPKIVGQGTTISITWDNGTCEDPESGIASYYLEVGNPADPSAYFSGNTGYVFQKTITMPFQTNTDSVARVCAVNGSGLKGMFSDTNVLLHVYSNPVITSVVPDTVKRGGTCTMNIIGSGFEPGASVACNGTDVEFGMPAVTTGQITITITVSRDAETGPRIITITNTDGGATSQSNSFNVREGLGGAVGDVRIQGGAHGYANPDQGDTVKIHFHANNPGTVSTIIYTLGGITVWKTSKDTDGGEDFIAWDGRNNEGSTVSSGIYPVYVDGPGIKKTKKIVIVR